MRRLPCPFSSIPPGGNTAGGTRVTKHGIHFTGATGVAFAGTAAASFTVNSDTKISATTAAHAATLPANVTVTTPLVTGTGTGLFTYVNLSNTTDTDGDGLNDAAELQLGGLGFDRQVAQTALVNSFLSSVGLYTPAQVQALNVGVPLLTKDAATGRFKLTIGVQKTADLALPFADFPMNGAGFTTLINGAGKLEFEFTVPDNAAFFRVGSQ